MELVIEIAGVGGRPAHPRLLYPRLDRPPLGPVAHVPVAERRRFARLRRQQRLARRDPLDRAQRGVVRGRPGDAVEPPPARALGLTRPFIHDTPRDTHLRPRSVRRNSVMRPHAIARRLGGPVLAGRARRGAGTGPGQSADRLSRLCRADRRPRHGARQATGWPGAEFCRRARAEGALLLDARSADAFARGHLKGAVNLPFTDFTDEALRQTHRRQSQPPDLHLLQQQFLATTALRW